MNVVVSLLNEKNVMDFVSICNRLPMQVDVKCGQDMVNGKSILGMLSLDRAVPLSVSIRGGTTDMNNEFLNELKEHDMFYKNARQIAG